MANFNVERSDLFPDGTVIKAYSRGAWHQAQGGVPTGPKVTEATMSSGVGKLEGLIEGSHYVVYAEVGGKDVYLEIAPVQLSAASLLAKPPAQPSAHGLLGWTYDPISASGTNLLGTAGTLALAKVFVPEACKISNIHLWMTTKGATLTALENGLGLFAEGTRKLLSQVAIAALIAAWEGATGELKLALEEPQNVPAGSLLVGAYFKGTTSPTFASGPNSPARNVNLATTGLRFASGDAGLTTALPATVTAAMAANERPIWVGVS